MRMCGWASDRDRAPRAEIPYSVTTLHRIRQDKKQNEIAVLGPLFSCLFARRIFYSAYVVCHRIPPLAELIGMISQSAYANTDSRLSFTLSSAMSEQAAETKGKEPIPKMDPDSLLFDRPRRRAELGAMGAEKFSTEHSL